MAEQRASKVRAVGVTLEEEIVRQLAHDLLAESREEQDALEARKVPAKGNGVVLHDLVVGDRVGDGWSRVGEPSSTARGSEVS